MSFSWGFRKTRVLLLGFTSLVSVLWSILLCIVLFAQWSVLDYPERALICLMLATHTVTAITLLILLSVLFRPWLDAARLMFLMTIHIGTAGAFTYMYPSFLCLSIVPSQQDVCKLIVAFILVASWITPVLLMTYSVYLSVVVRQAHRASSPAFDAENGQNIFCKEHNILNRPIPNGISDVDSDVLGGKPYVRCNICRTSPTGTEPARLSKPLPAFYF